MNLFDDLHDICRLDAPLGPLTWFGLGGTAEILVEPKSIEQLCDVLKRCHESDTEVHILGAGANVLVSDRRIPGVVVRLASGAFTQVTFDANRITAGAGVDLTQLVRNSIREGLAGLEPLAGIPGTVGGGIAMNCGGKFGDISEAVETVQLVTLDGQTHQKHREELGFGYRSTKLDGDCIVGATFLLKREDPASLDRRFQDIFAYKQDTQPPLGMRSAGCVFKNPDGTSAGELIDRTGLKGLRMGSAVVSDRHANFILADRKGSASDVIELIEFVGERVKQSRGIVLEREVCIW